jgi:methionyl-tRNA formyltransferase
MNIVFMGTSKFAVPALRKLTASEHRVLAVVTKPDKPKGRGQQVQPSAIKEVALEHDLYLYQPDDMKDPDFIRALRALSPDIIVVVAYGNKLPNNILDMPRYYCLNIHPSLLPRFRGPAPVARTIMKGETVTGVCILKVTEKMDAGPILGVMRADLPENATTPEMEEILSDLGADLLLEVIAAVGDRRAVEIPQVEREATYAKKFEKKDGRVDWRKSSLRIHNFIRALQPSPCAFAFWRKNRILIHKVVPLSAKKPDRRPGTIMEVEKELIRVASGDGEVGLLELQPQNKKRMSAAEFINGYGPKKDAFFS